MSTPKSFVVRELQEAVKDAYMAKRALAVTGGNTKSFYGRETEGDALSTLGYNGLGDYNPTELVVTAKAGTRLRELQHALNAEGQMLPFEPPHFGDTATLGGAIATGLSGPRRPYSGSARDYVLGISCINGAGEYLKFGGQVMKNVAGYDVSRLMTGAMGTLGVLLDISLKVLPKPDAEITLMFACDALTAAQKMIAWARLPYPVSGMAYVDGVLRVRLSGSESGIAAGKKAFTVELDGEEQWRGETWWEALRELKLTFFYTDKPVWRLAMNPATPALAINGVDEADWLIDWGGAQRWLVSDTSADTIRAAVGSVGGHATLFMGGKPNEEKFQPLTAPMFALQKRVKDSFDPEGILNPGRMYSGI